MMRITFLAVMPSPYVQDLFAVMADDPRFDLRVLYLEQVAPDTYWGEQEMPSYASVLPGRWYGFQGARVHYNPTACQVLEEREDDLVVVVGYIGLTNQLVMRNLTRRGQKWVFWGEVPGFRKRGLIGSTIRRRMQRPLRHAAGIAAVGSHAVEAYQNVLKEIAAPSIPVHNIPYCCRMDDFERAGERQRNLRSTQPQRQPIRFLYCGQLIERKGVDLLLNAFLTLLDEGAEAELSFLGTGPLSDQLTSQVPEHYRERVHFLGFHSVSELPELFATHDVFLLPSRHDGWGVVVNQAIATGMPVIVSDAVGAGRDLVKPDRNGLRVAAGSEQALHTALRQFVQHPELISAYGKESLAIADSMSVENTVNAWARFFQESLGTGTVAAGGTS
ncbi:MAG: glycosyltransferase family 4 protein [Planctomycetaceae bacterium]|nr:glycosyltransferase family 4 protein [Planctomycetaceae bacterium]